MRGPYSAAPCPRNRSERINADAPAEIDWRLCPACPGNRLGAHRHGGRAVSGNSRQQDFIDGLLCDCRAWLGLAGNAIGKLDEWTALRRAKSRIGIEGLTWCLQDY